MYKMYSHLAVQISTRTTHNLFASKFRLNISTLRPKRSSTLRNLDFEKLRSQMTAVAFFSQFWYKIRQSPSNLSDIGPTFHTPWTLVLTPDRMQQSLFCLIMCSIFSIFTKPLGCTPIDQNIIHWWYISNVLEVRHQHGPLILSRPGFDWALALRDLSDIARCETWTSRSCAHKWQL